MVWVGKWDSEVLCVRVWAQSPALVPGVDTVKWPKKVRRAAVHWEIAFTFAVFLSGEGCFFDTHSFWIIQDILMVRERETGQDMPITTKKMSFSILFAWCWCSFLPLYIFVRRWRTVLRSVNRLINYKPKDRLISVCTVSSHELGRHCC